MGVYIKGMEMPKSCGECQMLVYEGQLICVCRALSAIEDGEILKPWKNKRKDCPLVEVKSPHGRLGDLDALAHVIGSRNLNWEYGEGVSDCWDDTIAAPTLIEAEVKDDAL